MMPKHRESNAKFPFGPACMGKRIKGNTVDEGTTALQRTNCLLKTMPKFFKNHVVTNSCLIAAFASTRPVSSASTTSTSAVSASVRRLRISASTRYAYSNERFDYFSGDFKFHGERSFRYHAPIRSQTTCIYTNMLSDSTVKSKQQKSFLLSFFRCYDRWD